MRSIQIRWIPPVGVKTGNTEAIIPVLRRVLPAIPAAVDESHTRWGVRVSSPDAGLESEAVIDGESGGG